MEQISVFLGRSLTLNSSPYGLSFYKVIGFMATDRELTVNGIRFTPMLYNEQEGTQDI